MQTPRRQRLLRRGLATAVALTGAVAAVVYFTQEQRGATLSRELDASVTEFRAGRWERPVLHGTAEPGNAAAAIRGVLRSSGLRSRDLAPCWQRSSDGQLVRSEGLARIERTVGALRAATRRAWSWPTESTLELPDEDLSRPRGSGIVDHEAHLVGALLACDMELASSRSPAECLSTVADDVRVSQDLVAGGTEDALLEESMVVGRAAHTMAGCARNASIRERADAARVVRVLAEHPSPVVSVLRRRLLSRSLALRRSFARASIYDRDDRYPFRTRADVLDDWERELSQLRAWSRARQPTYAALQRQLVSELRPRRGAARFDYGVSEQIFWSRYTGSHVRSQAEVRGTALLLAIAADDPHLDQLLRLPSLTDPKTGAPMRVSRERMLSMTWVRVSPPTDHASPAYSLAIQIPDPEPVAAPAPP